MLVDYAIEHGFTIYKIFCDDDYSGLDKNRPAFNEMIRDAKLKKFDIIVCKNQSRFTRDMELIEKYLHGYFISWGIRFIGVVDNVDTLVTSNKKSRQINGLVNEWYCEDLSVNVRAALQTKKQNGQYLGHFCAYGYKLNPNDRHKILIDFEPAQVVKEIFDLCINGHGISAISKILTDKNYLTPYAYKFSKGSNYFNPNCKTENKNWSINTIRKILRDETYLGHLIQGREQKISYKINKIVKVPQKNWIVVHNNHEAIIDENIFLKAKKIILAKQEKTFTNTLSINVLANKIKCFDCGANMTISYGKNKVRYLKCSTAKKTKQCQWHTIRYEDILEILHKKIKKLFENYLSIKKNIFDIKQEIKIVDKNVELMYNFISFSEDFHLDNLTQHLINDFIDFIEISNTNNNIQHITIHWNF